jgi:hypothetical protein
MRGPPSAEPWIFDRMFLRSLIGIREGVAQLMMEQSASSQKLMAPKGWRRTVNIAIATEGAIALCHSSRCTP